MNTDALMIPDLSAKSIKVSVFICVYLWTICLRVS
jgi:hypothetical protein